MTKVPRPCMSCGKTCEPHERTTDGGYLHSACGAAVAPLADTQLKGRS